MCYISRLLPTKCRLSRVRLDWRPYFDTKSKMINQEEHFYVYTIRLKNSKNWWMLQKPLRKSCIPYDWFEHWMGMEGLWNIPWNKSLPYQSTLTISSGGSVQKIIYRHLLGNHVATCNLKWLISPQNVLVRIVLYNTLLSCSEFCSNLLESLGILALAVLSKCHTHRY